LACRRSIAGLIPQAGILQLPHILSHILGKNQVLREKILKTRGREGFWARHNKKKDFFSFLFKIWKKFPLSIIISHILNAKEENNAK